MTNFEPHKSVYTPPQVAKYGQDAVDRIASLVDNALTLGIPKLDGYFAPPLPGQLISIIAQTSNFKSGFVHIIEKNMAMQLSEQGRDDECIIHVSVEESIEEQAFLMFAREAGESAGDLARGKVQDWTKLKSEVVNPDLAKRYLPVLAPLGTDKSRYLRLTNFSS